ncbi:hypothetical protein A2686_01635 [Candidatus Woesebacteria bacterium RIFCSPHIGHO2_01_FULL_38_10]|uniref:PDZ domain-containing protein n=1 Tax=Candidatus Woesebacteria bacterium RIFCSPLOWO2_01_FULL_39_10b TaxID=1802517 RepID=A0A1F8B6C2_9BACT|nr:MAG: hypothetical protein A2686_01635 [Candidatus Woesebacteria bacterium RIFCSPHIGHO2_01_FULL_38_10]OGM59596.1 MAG: hypothetical protein A2892_04600 [Candidatus Woesebacteria bacterium RIFCSPLOWO2_01_FULL_39_10b]
MTSFLIFIIILSILILAHELGHFIAARRSGVWVEEFGFGIPPRIFGKKIGETFYSINLLPFGGFVKLHGESARDKIEKPEKAFLNKSKKSRALIVTAGVIMNFLLAILAFSLVYSFSGIPRKVGYIEVLDVNKDSPAQKAGLTPKDIVRSVDYKKVSTSKEFIKRVEEKKGREVRLEIQKPKSQATLPIFLSSRENPPEGEGPLGVIISDSEIYFPPLWQRPIFGIYFGLKEALFWGSMIILGFIKIISGLFLGIVPKDIAGPVGLYAITSEVYKVGILPLINWLGIISVNLAILNILPIPAFDGGHLLFIIIEKIIGRKVLPKVEAWLHAASLTILVFLLLAITIKELKLINSLGITGYLDFLSGLSSK